MADPVSESGGASTDDGFPCTRLSAVWWYELRARQTFLFTTYSLTQNSATSGVLSGFQKQYPLLLPFMELVTGRVDRLGTAPNFSPHTKNPSMGVTLYLFGRVRLSIGEKLAQTWREICLHKEFDGTLRMFTLWAPPPNHFEEVMSVRIRQRPAKRIHTHLTDVAARRPFYEVWNQCFSPSGMKTWLACISWKLLLNFAQVLHVFLCVEWLGTSDICRYVEVFIVFT